MSSMYLESKTYHALMVARRKVIEQKRLVATEYAAINNSLGSIVLPRDRRKRQRLLSRKVELESQLRGFKELLRKNAEQFDEICNRARVRLDEWLREFNSDELPT